jgi:hypothetical protein
MRSMSDRIDEIALQCFTALKVDEATKVLSNSMPKVNQQRSYGIVTPGHQILKAFHKQYVEEIETNKTKNLIPMFKVMACSGWNNFAVANSFIKGFGEGFDTYSKTELVDFCVALGHAGLKQEDIFQSVVEKISGEN